MKTRLRLLDVAVRWPSVDMSPSDNNSHTFTIPDFCYPGQGVDRISNPMWTQYIQHGLIYSTLPPEPPNTGCSTNLMTEHPMRR